MPYKSKTFKRAGKKGRNPGSWKRGQSGNPKGKAVGTVNAITRDLKHGIIEAAVRRGRDGKGKDGLIGYLEFLARTEPKSFAGLLGRLVPLHIVGGLNVNHTLMSREDVAKALSERGLTGFQPIIAIGPMNAKPVDAEILPAPAGPVSKFAGQAPPRDETSGKPHTPPKAA